MDSIDIPSPESLWRLIVADAEAALAQEPTMGSLVRRMVLERDNLADAWTALLGQRLGKANGDENLIRTLCGSAFVDTAILEAIAADMQACARRDPAFRTWLQPMLFFKGVAALVSARVSHGLWQGGQMTAAFCLQSRCSEAFQVDIHPAARLGRGLFLDHATGIVIGETSVIGDDVSMLHEVTLGGNGKDRGDRHPRVGRGVLIAAGAKVLGNIRIGDEARIAACSVVLEDVAPHTTVAGIPARVVRTACPPRPAEAMEHGLAPVGR